MPGGWFTRKITSNQKKKVSKVFRICATQHKQKQKTTKKCRIGLCARKFVVCVPLLFLPLPSFFLCQRPRFRLFCHFGGAVALEQLVKVLLKGIRSQGLRSVLQSLQVGVFALAVFHHCLLLSARLPHTSPQSDLPRSLLPSSSPP